MMQDLNDKERALVQAYVNNGFNKKAAYRSVFPNAADSTCEVNGYKALSKPTIKAAVQELTEQKTSQLKDSKDSIVNEAIAITQEARKVKQYSAAIKALDTRAKLGGFYDQDADDVQKYAQFVQQIKAKNITINMNDSTKQDCNKDDVTQDDMIEVDTHNQPINHPP